MQITKTRSLLGNRYRSAYSLRSRYLAVTALVTLIIIIGTLIAQYYVERDREVRNHNLKLYKEATLLIRMLRGSMLDVERNFNLFLRVPSEAHQQRVQMALAQAVSQQKQLHELEGFKNSAIARELNGLGNDLHLLQGTLDRRMEGLITSGGTHTITENSEQQFVHIWEYLQRLDVHLEDLSKSNMASLAAAANTTSTALWVLSLFGITILVIGAIYFERSILTPITQVTSALRNEALGVPHEPLPDAQSNETHHLIEAFNEMHQQVQQRQRSLEHLALHDTLTGLANREQLIRAIQQALDLQGKDECHLALIMIGLNRFKEINNSLGHSVGDQLLIAVAQRLNEATPVDAVLARVNGDGFALLLPGGKKGHADHFAGLIIRILESPFEVESQSLYVSATLGLAFSPGHGHQPLDLLQKAEVAMQAAKQQNINLTHYSSEHDQHAMRRLALANELRQELHNSQKTLSLVYQPQLDMRSGKVYGMEALLRWNSQQRERVSPDELIHISEQTGLIYQLTPWVLERAFEEFASLKSIHGKKPVLAVNLSALNLHHADFPYKLERLMEKWAIEPALLELEITESAMMADPARAHRTLGHIHSMGVDLTIDDFGTGFSSLTYLKHLPVSKLKIDKSFVLSMIQDENDAVIIRSTIDMAHNMGLRVVAEGVETQETYDLLEILGCDIVQGYLISTPLDIASMEKWYQVTAQHQPTLQAGLGLRA